MRLLNRLSLQGKLITIMLVTSVSGVFLTAVLVFINETFSQQRAIREQLSTLATMISVTSTAAVIFNDPEAAGETLSALSAEPGIVYAAIYKDEKVFAHYQLPFDRSPPAIPDETNAQGIWITDDMIHLYQSIVLDGRAIGALHITADLQKLYVNLLDYLAIVLAIMSGASLLTWVLSAYLQRLISTPIVKLHQAMQVVSQDDNYSVRVARSSDDELGTLVDGFNHMLDQIQTRDEELARYSATLEEQVAARTKALSKANRERILWLETMARFLRHELKNTMIGFRSCLDLIERRTQEEAIAPYLTRARTSLTYMGKLLDGIGNASSLEATCYSEQHSRLDLSALVKTRVKEYRNLYPQPIVLDQFAEGIEILGNDIRILQMLDKLVANASEHSKPKAAIRLGLYRQADWGILCVANEGEQLPDNKKDIFQLFVSMRVPERKSNDNLGLGLYVVKLIAESHGGRVRAEDLETATGALFTVSLPLAEALDTELIQSKRATG